MNTILLYLAIFFLKVIENALGTIRVIVVNNNKKVLAALLQFTNTLIWILSAGMVIIDIQKDMLKVFFFALGSLYGSYLGSQIEEKMSLGNSLIICITEKKIAFKIRKCNYTVTETKGTGINNLKYILLIVVPRYKIKDLASVILYFDADAVIGN